MRPFRSGAMPIWYTCPLMGLVDAPEYVMDRLGAAGGSSVRASHGLEFVLPCA